MCYAVSCPPCLFQQYWYKVIFTKSLSLFIYAYNFFRWFHVYVTVMVCYMQNSMHNLLKLMEGENWHRLLQ